MGVPENSGGEQSKDPRLDTFGLFAKYFKKFMSDQEIGSLKRSWEEFQAERSELARKRGQAALVAVPELPGIEPLVESDCDLMEIMWMDGEEGLTGTDLANVIQWSRETDAA